ncbi:hypothetical protein BZG36_02885 [Bifiguratus adelaidae]|uniref:Large ribosomal subunit protein bL21m n=1 Tax=Bifiguratus adelaidae TaxID=1938954 RepID=A0A261Y223_9FUNG|nr:hypothetical protein BZG36_02885 [Bifiguratus adelaidae]
MFLQVWRRVSTIRRPFGRPILPSLTVPSLRFTSTSTLADSLQKLRSQPNYFCVVDIVGRPFLVTKNDLVILPRLADVKLGDILDLHQVREIGSKDYSLKGGPYVDKTLVDVKAVVVEQPKSEMIEIFKKKRRKGYQRTIRHKQTHTVLRITHVGVAS